MQSSAVVARSVELGFSQSAHRKATKHELR